MTAPGRFKKGKFAVGWQRDEGGINVDLGRETLIALSMLYFAFHGICNGTLSCYFL